MEMTEIDELREALEDVIDADKHRTFIEGCFRLAFSHSPAGCAICSEDGGILFINNTLAEWIKEVDPRVNGKLDLKDQPIMQYVASFNISTLPVELVLGHFHNVGINVPEAYPRAFESGRLMLIYATRTPT